MASMDALSESAEMMIKNINELSSNNERVRTFAKTALVLAIPGLLLLGLLWTLCGDPNVINC